ncbi:tetratricopeptide repeat protein [Streptomyces seoulensis]
MSGNVYGPSVQAAHIHGDVYLGDGTFATRTLIPRQLPPATAHFTDRADVFGALDQARASGDHPFVVISGPPGVGKTSAALAWLHRTSADYPSGQLYVDLQGSSIGRPVSPSTVLPWFLRALGFPADQVPADLAEQTALYRTVTADRQIAVLCDNALSAAQVRPLLPASPSSVCLVTSRWRLTSLVLDGAVLLPLGPLETDAAVELLGRIAGSEVVTRDADTARSFVASYGRFPLAVCIGASLLALRPPGRDVAATAQGLAATLRSAVADDRTVSMTACLDQSFAALPTDTARLYARLGLHPKPEFTAELALAVAATGPPISDVPEQLTTLVEASLLTTPGSGRYRFHDLIHEHARIRAESAETSTQRAETLRRIVDWYLMTANLADHVLYPQRRRPEPRYDRPPSHLQEFAGPTAALEWFETERTNLMAVQRLAVEHRLHAAAWQLADAMWVLFSHLRYYEDWITSHEIGIAEATTDNHLLAEARLRNGLGVALRLTARYDEALRAFGEALPLRRRLGDRRGEGLVLYNIGLVHRDLGELDQAAAVLRESIAVKEEAGDTRGVARGYSAIGEVESLSGHHAEALSHLLRARAMLVGTGDRTFEALAERLLGEAQLRSGNLTAARTHLTAALARYAEAGPVFDVGTTHEALAELADQEGRPADAREHYARAHAVYTRLGALKDAERASERSRRSG